MIERLSSRKFVISIGLGAATTTLAAYGKMTGDVATVFLAIVASYNIANAYVTGAGNGK